jgi:hypothetical protein
MNNSLHGERLMVELMPPGQIMPPAILMRKFEVVLTHIVLSVVGFLSAKPTFF